MAIDKYIKGFWWKGRQRNQSVADWKSCFKGVGWRIIGNEVYRGKLRERYSVVDGNEI